MGRLLINLALTGGLGYLAVGSTAAPLLVVGVRLLVALLAVDMVQGIWAWWQLPPLLQLSVWGIKLGRQPLDLWEEIRQEQVTATSPRGRTLLRYQVGPAIRQLDLSASAISAADLAALLQHYRQRSSHLVRLS